MEAYYFTIVTALVLSPNSRFTSWKMGVCMRNDRTDVYNLHVILPWILGLSKSRRWFFSHHVQLPSNSQNRRDDKSPQLYRTLGKGYKMKVMRGEMLYLKQICTHALYFDQTKNKNKRRVKKILTKPTSLNWQLIAPTCPKSIREIIHHRVTVSGERYNPVMS